jgi:LPS-assembly protein
MNNHYKGKIKYISASAVLLLLVGITMTGIAKDFFPVSTPISKTDTVPNKSLSEDTASIIKLKNTLDSVPKNIQDTTSDTTLQKIDTLKIKISKDSLSAPVIYHADDSMVMDMPSKKIFLYGKETETKYQANDLTAPGMEFDQQTHLVTASLRKDSTGKVIAFPTFKQGDSKSISDTIRFNMKTGKGLTKGTYTKQGDMYVYGKTIKKISPDVFFAYKGRFTTCDLDTPHFAFVSNKIKFINKKMAITGPVHPEFEGVPIPLYLPFGIFPLTEGRHSGLLAPTFSANEQLGLSLTGLGYYKVLSDNWDVTARGTIYSYGSWVLDLSSTYYKRYHYRGNFSFNYQNFKYNFKGDPDYSVSKSFQIVWNHTADTKALPGVTFAASVNAGSSSFNAAVPNSPYVNFTNQLSSTIQYSKVWKDEPFNITIAANHNQNTLLKQINVTLPDVSFNLNTLYPFRRKEVVGEMKWYENIGIALNTNAKSLTSFYDDSVGEPSIGNQISQNLQWGASHSVPISLSLPQIGPLQISPGVSYAEHWFDRQIFQNLDSIGERVDTTIHKGFYTARDMSFNLGLSTRIFGLVAFGKNSYIQAIRQEFRPSISVSYSPDMNGQYYHNIQVDTFKDVRSYSVYDGTIYGGFGAGKFGGLNFTLDNNFQMKIKSKKDTGENAIKKISLLDDLSLGGSYNFLADSFQLSNLSVSAHTSLFNKVTITASANLDPYQTDSRGNPINKLVWQQKLFTLGRLTSSNIDLSTQFKGGDTKSGSSSSNTTQSPGIIGQPTDPNTGLPLNEYQTELAYMNNNPGMNTDFSIPWSIGLSYSLNLIKAENPEYTGMTTTVSQNLNWNGTLGLTPKWQVGLNGSYNITQSDLGILVMTLARDMHCWQMAIEVSPVGTRFFNITISPKSGLLKDIKFNRMRYFQ